MRAAKAIAILLCGPLVGILIAIVLSVLAVPPDPNFASTGHAAPGDGFLVMGFVFVSLVISVPLSIVGAGFVFLRKVKREQNTTHAVNE